VFHDAARELLPRDRIIRRTLRKPPLDFCLPEVAHGFSGHRRKLDHASSRRNMGKLKPPPA
jgi:hypothetical protein